VTERYISYLRVSTDRQGRSGLGLDAQRDAVAAYLAGEGRVLAGEYVEVESGAHDGRPQLAAALARCRLTGATLIVAKLDRLSRNQAFLMSVYEGSGDGGVVFCDLPSIPSGPVGKFLVQQMAAVAELERGLISQRTKAALAASRKVLGGYRGGPVVDHHLATDARKRAADAFAVSVSTVIKELRAQGLTLAQVAAALTDQRVRTPRGGAWTAESVRRVCARVPLENAMGRSAGDQFC